MLIIILGNHQFFGAIKWCLKGGEIFKENSTYTKSETFNEISLLKNESEMSVEIEFEHENSNFYLSRKSKIKVVLKEKLFRIRILMIKFYSRMVMVFLKT